MIELLAVNKSFAGHKVLSDINLFIQEGEIFGIIGRSGAGKSTLLRCINVLGKPDSGQVYVDGQNLMTLKPKALAKARHKIAMIFQHFNLLASKNVYDNIALPMRICAYSEAAIRTKVEELLALVGLEDKSLAFIHALSGGQKQRVAIARALSTEPKILLCDEATSALDPESTLAILELLKKINTLYGLTIVMITHEMDVIKRICHRLALMQGGRIIESSALANVFLDTKSLIATMLYQHLSPSLPACLSKNLSQDPNEKPLLKLFFQGKEATEPFISRVSRELAIPINILLANIDHFDGITCGVLVVELFVSPECLEDFMLACKKHAITVEILGYVSHALV